MVKQSARSRVGEGERDRGLGMGDRIVGWGDGKAPSLVGDGERDR
jgi:hypothetical protein